MAEFLPPVIFEVKAKATEAIASFKEINLELDKMEKKALLAGGSISKMEKASKYAGATILGLAGAFGVLAFTSVEKLDAVEKAQANLETAIKNTGVSFDAAKPAVDAHAQSMTKLGFSVSETYAALAKMTAASGSPQMALDSLSAAADLARFKNIDLATAGTIVARASIGQARGLADLGLALGKTIPKGANMATIMKLIADRTKGAAEAFGSTLAGKLAIARANFEQLQIKIGTDLVPTLSKVTDWITNVGIPKFGQFVDLIKNNQGVFKGLIAALAVIWAVPKVAAIVTAIQTIIKVYEALRAAAATAAVATALATGGVSLAAGTAAIAAGAAIYGGFKLKDLLQNWDVTPTAQMAKGSLPKGGGQTLSTSSNLQGKGVKLITPTPTPKPAVQQNITVYASDTNDIAKKMARAAKNGIPAGGGR